MILSRHERMIARRYLLPGKGEGFIFLVAGISLVAVALGVAALIIVMSVMNGFRAELFDKIVGLNGHAVVQGYGGRLPDWRDLVEKARATPGVTEAVPLIEQPLMASADGRVEGVLLRGMRREDILTNPTLDGNVVAGSLEALRPGSENVALGIRLAEALGPDCPGALHEGADVFMVGELAEAEGLVDRAVGDEPLPVFQADDFPAGTLSAGRSAPAVA